MVDSTRLTKRDASVSDPAQDPVWSTESSQASWLVSRRTASTLKESVKREVEVNVLYDNLSQAKQYEP